MSTPLTSRLMLSGGRWREHIDVVCGLLGVILGVAISLLNLIYSNEYLITIGPMLIIVCAGYVLFRRPFASPPVEHEASSRFILIVNIVFWLAVAGSIYSLSTEILHRPPVYFGLTALAAAIIAFQIFHCRGRGTTYLIICQILVLSLSVRASAFFVFPTLPGSDPWEHLNYITDFVNLGHIESTHGYAYYLGYPIMHLNAAAMKMMTGVGYKMAMFLAVGLPVALSTIFVFLIGRNLANAKVGLLAMLLVSLADFHLQWSIQLVPTGFGLALFSIVTYIITRGKPYRSVAIGGLTLLLLFVMIINHTMSAFVMFAFLLFFVLGERLHKLLFDKPIHQPVSMVTPLLVMMFGVSMLAYWTCTEYFGGKTFFVSVTDGLFAALTQRAGFLERPEAVTAEAGNLYPIMNIAGFLGLYLFTTLGCLFWLRQEQQTRTRIALVVAIVLLTAFALSFPTIGLRNIMPYRWYSFIYVLLAALAAFSMLQVASRPKHERIGSMMLAAIAFVVSFFMITNSQSNLDSPLYTEGISHRSVYTASEMAVAVHVVESYDGTIVADSRYCGRVLETHMGRQNTSSQMLDLSVVHSGLVVWREVMASRPIYASGTLLVLGEEYQLELFYSHDLVYRNSSSKVFAPTTK